MKASPNTLKYILAVALGAIGGGIVAIVITRAIPKMMAGMMDQMMPKMMAHMKECGCSPET